MCLYSRLSAQNSGNLNIDLSSQHHGWFCLQPFSDICARVPNTQRRPKFMWNQLIVLYLGEIFWFNKKYNIIINLSLRNKLKYICIYSRIFTFVKLLLLLLFSLPWYLLELLHSYVFITPEINTYPLPVQEISSSETPHENVGRAFPALYVQMS